MTANYFKTRSARIEFVPRTVKRHVSRFIAKMTETLLPGDVVTRLRTEREWKRWLDSLTPETLDDLTDTPNAVKQQLFKANVRLVEIEAHARCNRICSFCSNVIADRRKNKTIADPGMLSRVFDELGVIDFAGQIKVARYSEPLADLPALLDCIASARARVPHAQLAVVTNTDYLTRAALDRLADAGLDVLYASLYLGVTESWSFNRAGEYNERLANKLGLEVHTKRETPVSVHWVFKYRNLEVRSSCMNWDNYGIDRAGTMPQYVRENRLGPCRAPFDTFVIDYDGSIVPCCNIRSDIPGHRKLVVGKLAHPDLSIFDVYAGRLSAWRRSMVGFADKAFPCTTCRHLDVPNAFATPIALRLENRLKQIGRAELFRAPKTVNANSLESALVSNDNA